MSLCSSTRSCCESFHRIAIGFQSILLLAMRLYWGYFLFESGLGKLQDIPKVAVFFTNLGIPFPVINAYISGGIECVGGALLVIGLFSRFAALLVAIVMIVALLTAHIDGVKAIFVNPPLFLSLAPITYLLSVLVIFAFGAGVFSFDYLLRKLCCKKDK